MQISSAAFADQSTIPSKYSCEGSDSAPPVEFANVPEGTRSLALIVDDPDAPGGIWVHWVVYDLPAITRSLPEGGTLPAPAKAGTNDFGKRAYGGPCPPPGQPHRYYFKLFALDRMIDLAAGASNRELEQAMRGHVLAECHLVGLYGR